MATNTRQMRGLSPADVFAVLEDGMTYADWVVGTRAIRDVEAGWPQPQTSIHYTVGYAPLRHDSNTVSLAHVPDERLELEAQAWPVGAMRIVLTVVAAADGAVVTIEEWPARGIAKTLHNPAFDLLVKARNVETLRRLEAQARERRG